MKFFGRPAPGMVWAAFCAFAIEASAAESLTFAAPSNLVATPAPSSYMRVHRPDAKTIELQIAVRKFEPKKKNGKPVLWLAAVSHLGDTNYYQALQTHLDAQGLVLFEGVTDQTVRRHGGKTTGTPMQGVEFADALAEASRGSLQSAIARALGLAFQLEAVNYRRAHFRNSDLSISQLQQLILGQARAGDEADGAAAAEFESLLSAMEGTSFLGGLMTIGAGLIGSSPKLQTLSKLAMIEVFGQFEGDFSKLGKLPAEVKRLLAVLIEARNQAVIEDLKSELKRKRTSKSISVLYGAGHMVDLEARLARELGYKPSGQFWLTAVSVDTRAAGLTEAELELVRGLVKWQLDLMQQ